ncbi:hypothetical protein BJY04DRAFT_216395 [Aspergillus karnatakaensis]|uniref:uncharacterized protein n=1 Tax=Aspergillus karnatakaensis TaxID=1810916 RepID=UPI003CCD7AB1
MRFANLVAFLPLLFPAAQALTAPIDGYEVSEPEWELEVLPGKTIIVNGTFEDAYEEALKHNPNFHEEYTEPHYKRQLRQLELTKRFNQQQEEWGLTSMYCGDRPDWLAVDVNIARKVINDVMRFSGKPIRGPGWANCERVRCHNTGALWWCNDAPNTRELPGYTTLTRGANFILASCVRTGFGEGHSTKGQAFHRDNWNVIVRKC